MEYIRERSRYREKKKKCNFQRREGLGETQERLFLRRSTGQGKAFQAERISLLTYTPNEGRHCPSDSRGSDPGYE